ncbi:MAG: octanoyltransferase [Cyclobacteriaceae bacterium]|nr:MAG: octanoyltransferase [Cyclobacteriaceae bacterium]
MSISAANRKVKFIDLGVIEYRQAWHYQDRLMQEILAQKVASRNSTAHTRPQTSNYLIFCQHPHVYTLGRNGHPAHLLADAAQLERLGATYVHTNRGGDITYHGPGQLVGYPVLDLENFFTDIHRYMRSLEEAIILTLQHFGLPAGRIEGLTGVWVDPQEPHRARKICAMGVKTSRWVTLHGFALNVNTNLSYFNYIVPCGIRDKAVTSMEKELGRSVALTDVALVLKAKLAEVFEMEWI